MNAIIFLAGVFFRFMYYALIIIYNAVWAVIYGTGIWFGLSVTLGLTIVLTSMLIGDGAAYQLRVFTDNIPLYWGIYLTTFICLTLKDIANDEP